jgi:formylglycine-generating enzyme required for sulfatase activity
MTNRNHYWNKHLVIVSLGLCVLTAACIDFPTLPALSKIPDQAISNPNFMIDQQVSDQDIEQIRDMINTDMTLVDQIVMRDMLQDQLVMSDQKLMIEVDMQVNNNFNLYKCNGAVLESIEEGIATTMPCDTIMKDSIWIQVNPIPGGVGIGIDEDSVNMSDQNTTPKFTAELGYTYYMMRREVHAKEYQACTRSLDCVADNSMENGCVSRDTDSNLPLNCITWTKAQNFCQQIGGSLPTEVEWEIASSLGRSYFPNPWRSSILSNFDIICEYENILACYDNNDQELKETCSKIETSNSYPLCDTIGNLAEWMLDDWTTNLDLLPSDGKPYRMNLSSNILSCIGDQRKATRGTHFRKVRNTSSIDNAQFTTRSESNCSSSDFSDVTGFRCVLSEMNHAILETSDMGMINVESDMALEDTEVSDHDSSVD